MNDDDRPLADDELRAILGPILKRLVLEHGIEGANLRLKEIVRRVGLNPDSWEITGAGKVGAS